MDEESKCDLNINVDMPNFAYSVTSFTICTDKEPYSDIPRYMNQVCLPSFKRSRKYQKRKCNKIRKARIKSMLTFLNNQKLIDLERRMYRDMKVQEYNEIINDARTALRGLKRKLKETRKSLERIRHLEKIRVMIKNTCEDVDTDEELFVRKSSEIKQKIFNQISYYKNEKESLISSIQSYKAKIDVLKKSFYSDKENFLSDYKIEVKKALFGPSVQPDKIYNGIFSSHDSLGSFFKNRSLWDQFLDDNGSALPSNWHIPPYNCHPLWMDYFVSCIRKENCI